MIRPAICLIFFSGLLLTQPWAAPFAKDTSQVISQAKTISAPQGADAVVLLDEQKYNIDAQGRITS